jgi:hypothetical protein
MTKNRLKGIWENAVSLADAWHHFAPNDMQLTLEEMPNFAQKLKNEQKPNGWLDVAAIMVNAQSASTTRNKFINTMRENLLDDLFNKNLSALGYRYMPSKSRGLVQIDPVYFDYPDIDWDGNRAEFNGKAYHAIRIFNPRDLSDDQKLRTGRPGSGAAINAAIKSLILENQHFCTQSRKIACDQIRKFINNPIISGNGLSDKNLEKYILRNCDCRRITINSK